MGELVARGIVPSFFICAMLDGKDHLKFFQTINDKTAGEGQWAFVDSQGDRALAGQALADIVGLPDVESAQWSGRSIWLGRKRVMVM